MTASPTAPPRLRVRLNRPEAFFTRSGGRVPSAMLLVGTIANIMPIAAQDLRQQQLVEIVVAGDPGHLVGAEREDDEAERR